MGCNAVFKLLNKSSYVIFTFNTIEFSFQLSANGRTGWIFGGGVPSPSTLGRKQTFCLLLYEYWTFCPNLPPKLLWMLFVITLIQDTVNGGQSCLDIMINLTLDIMINLTVKYVLYVMVLCLMYVFVTCSFHSLLPMGH